MRFLDPRFKMMAVLIDDDRETLDFRVLVRGHAEMIADQCGYTFTEALAAAGVRLREQETAEPPCHQSSPGEDNEGGAEAPPTDAPPEGDEPPSEDAAPGGQIADALKANPSRSDRDVARACGASPTTVGKVRAALGLDRPARIVTRGGKAYEMEIGNRS